MRGGVISNIGCLEEEVLCLFKAREFGIEPFQQGEHPHFAVVDLLGDLRSGVLDPVYLVL